MAWPAVYGLSSSDFDPAFQIVTAQYSSIVLVHDAFHCPAHLSKLKRELLNAGRRVTTPHLPSSLSIYQQNILETDVQAIYQACVSDIDGGRDVVLVLHGYAGLPGSTAAQRLNQHSLRRPRAGFVISIIFVAAVIANAGESYLELLRPHWLSNENGYLQAQNPELLFFQDCSRADTRAAVSAISTQLLGSLTSKITSPGWNRVPCVYILCGLDQAVPLTAQQAFLQKLQMANSRVTIFSLQCGHSPFLTCPRNLAAIILQSATGTR